MELKPCPFCGGEAVLVATSGCSGHISCIGECKMQTGKFWTTPMYLGGVTEPEKWHEIATEMWNRRVEDAISNDLPKV